MRIKGRISTGSGLASSPDNASYAARLIDFGSPIESGTLNVTPDDLASAEAELAKIPGKRSVDAPNDRKGHLLWWRGLIHSERTKGAPAPCFMIRHERNALPYLELMGRIHLRKANGFLDGDPVEIELTAE